LGNWDPKNYPFDIGVIARVSRNKDFRKIKYLLTKKFRLIDFKLVELDEFILVGGASTTSPGRVDKKTIEKIRSSSDDSRKKIDKLIKRRLKEYERREKIYIRNFTRARTLSRKTGKPVVFLTHNAPYGTKMSKIRSKSAPKEVWGKHMGSYLERKMINRFKPDVVVCGHMHENFGKQKLGKTLVINSGTAMKNHYVKFEVGKR